MTQTDPQTQWIETNKFYSVYLIEGKYYATSVSAPNFCLEADTLLEAKEKAHEALLSYANWLIENVEKEKSGELPPL